MRRRPTWLSSWTLGLIAISWLLVWTVVAATMSDGRQATTIPYTTFVAQAAAGNVPRVTMQGDAIDGTFKTPITPPASSSPVARGAADGGAPSDALPPIQDFRTTVPAVGDPTLLPLLDAEQVQIDVLPVSASGSAWTTVIAWVLPLLLFVGVMLFMSRRLGGGQEKIFDFSKSTARRYSEEFPTVTFADVAGEDAAKRELEELVEFLRAPHAFTRLGGKMPRGVLLAGPPGTGKTLLAKATAGEAHVPFFSLSGSEFVEMFVGVGASRVRDLFAKAKAAAPAIIFVDELDAVGRQRGAGLGGGHDEREQTLNQLLVEMDGFDSRLAVVVLAATNRPDVLDPALLRPGRFDRQVTLDRPDRQGREAVLRIHTRLVPLAQDVNVNELARLTPGLVGADLANLVNEAAIMATRRAAERVARRDFEAALDKVLLGPEHPRLLDGHERTLVAYHESGHALVALLLPKADPVRKVSIVPHGQALGVTLQMPLDDRRNYPEDYLLARMAVLLGGRVAEELVFGAPSSGAENDLANVTKLARQMIARWGMSPKLGRLAFSAGEVHPFLGRELASDRDYSEATAALIDEEMRRLVEERASQTEQLLRTHRDLLDRLAAALLEHETLDAQQLEALFGGELPKSMNGAASPRPEPAQGASVPSTADRRRRQLGRVPALAMTAAAPAPAAANADAL